MEPNLENELTKLKIRTALDFPFYGTVGLLVPQVFEDFDVAPAFTDGARIVWSKYWWEQLQPNERLFVHLHEISHICLMHPIIGKEIKDKLGDRYDHQIAQEASDHAVNILLVRSGYTPPSTVELSYCDWQFEDMTFEEIYAELAKRKDPPEEPTEPDDDEAPPNGGDSAGGDGQAGPTNPDPLPKADQLAVNPGDWTPATSATSKQLETNIEQLLNQAQQTNAGDTPEGLDRQINYLKARNIDWRSLLTLCLFNAGCSEYTWRRPHRALLQEDILVPGTQENERGRILLVVDTSGSMTPDDIAKATDFLEQIRLTFKNIEIEVGSHDIDFYKGPTFGPGQPIETNLVLKGGGGTRFEPTIQYINSQPHYDAIVWLTDGENFDHSFRLSFKPEHTYIWLLNNPTLNFSEKGYPGTVCRL